MTLPGGGTVSYQYDPFGRRIEKISPSGTTIYAYDGDNVVEELDGSGTAVARYAQGLGVDEPLAMYRGGASYYYNADGLGSITSLTDASGQIAASYTYDSFGKLTASTGTVTNPFRYTGREFDPDSGLYYYRARYYDSSVGRFISEDPADFDGGTNFYDYSANDPVTLTDPWGLWHCVAGANCNFNPELRGDLDCFDRCTGRDTAITSGRRPPSPRHPHSSHSRGEACDIGQNSNPNLGLNSTQRCFHNCFTHGYGREERNQGAGTHYHFQLNPVPGGRPGFAHGIQPYNP